MFSRKVWIIVLVVVVVVGVFGWDRAVGYATGVKDSIRETVSEHTSTKMDVATINKLLVKEARKIDEFHDEIAELGDKIKGEEEKVIRVAAEIKEQRLGLTKARNLIEQKQEVYFIGHRNRTLREIEHDAHARIRYLKTLDAQLVLSNTLIDTLTKTERSCRATLSEANKNILAKQVELEQMKAREINAEIQAQANALSQSLVGMSDSVLNHSELQEAMDIYAKKIARKERGAGQVDQSDSPWIDYSEAQELPNLVAQINEVLIAAEVSVPAEVSVSAEVSAE